MSPTPQTYCSFILIIIGKHELGLFVSKGGTGKLVIHIPDFYPHLFHIKQGIIALHGVDI